MKTHLDIQQYLNQVIKGDLVAADIDLLELQNWAIEAQATGDTTIVEKSLVATFIVIEAKKNRFIEELRNEG